MGGLFDLWVIYWELEKWVVKLWFVIILGKFVLLKINMEVGYGGVVGWFDYLKEVVYDYVFVVWEETAPVKLPTMHCPRPGFTGQG